MLYEVEGDILLTEAQAIGHGVAPNDDFKQGLALSLREGHPELYKDFRHEMHQKHMPEKEHFGSGLELMVSAFITYLLKNILKVMDQNQGRRSLYM